MKTFLKIVAGVILFLVVLGVALSLYFTDDRLRSMVLPYLNDAVGREVQVESMSLSFFSTFPRPGLSVHRMSIPGEAEGDTLLSMEELVVGVKLFPLLRNEIGISEIEMNRPRFTWRIHADSTTNLDFLETDTTAEEGEAWSVDIPRFQVTDGRFRYHDLRGDTTELVLREMDADITLRYAEQIESSVDLDVGAVHASAGGVRWLDGLPVRLTEESVIDMDEETVRLEEGTLSIRGLALNLQGEISRWSEQMTVDLAFSSSSDNFGELLRLVPEEYEEQVSGLETRGELTLEGTVSGPAGGETPPAFQMRVAVVDGYLKNPDLEEPVENIQLTAVANNERVTLERLEAGAGENTLSASGTLERPLEENGTFTLDLLADVNLSTVGNFYDIGQFDIEEMEGRLHLDATASGNRSDPENAEFSGTAQLEGGMLRYRNVTEAITGISVDAQASQEQITLNSFSFSAAENTFSMNGTVSDPLREESRTVDLDTDLRFDLATVKNFYPIDGDTLEMRGLLTAQATLRGPAGQLEQAVQSGTITLQNGYIDYHRLEEPVRDLSLESSLEGNRLSIRQAGFASGENRLDLSGTVTDYLSEGRSVDLQLSGDMVLREIADYYDLEPSIRTLTGDAALNLSVRGPVNDPAELALAGEMTVRGMTMEGDSLPQPVRDLNGQLELDPRTATLDSLDFDLGSSDIAISGSLRDYMAYLKNRAARESTPVLEGSFRSRHLNLDELIDWQDTTEAETPIHLPDLNSSVTARIDEMVITGVTMSNLRAEAGTTPERITLEEATVELFDGVATGAFVWEVPRPDRTAIRFEGTLDSLLAQTFFEEYRVLGEGSTIHEHLSGAFSAEVEYASELDVWLTPDIATTEMSGSFGMTKARLRGHPIQEELADLFAAGEFRNMALDSWESTFSVGNSVLRFDSLRITSGDIGAGMSGTQHLQTDRIDYRLRLFLPSRFSKGIAAVITEQGVKALTQENGTIMVPLRITGTSADPQVEPDQEVIGPIIKEFLKDGAGNLLRRLFGNGN